jgi:CHAD domain-containing protein
VTPEGQLQPPLALAAQEVEKAAHALRSPSGIHDARRSLKRARALAALCEHGDQGTGVRASRRILRDAARKLSDARDREVAAELVESAAPAAELPEELVRNVKEIATLGAAPRSTLREVRRELETGAGRLRDLARDTHDGVTAGGGIMARLEASYRRCRKRARAAGKAPTAEALHSLRKAGKVLRYQLEWLSPVWPVILGAWVEELHQLTDELGHVNDVTVLRHALAEPSSPELRPRVAEALDAAHRESLRCRQSALERSERLFAEKPGAFRRRMSRIAGGALGTDEFRKS